MNNSNKRDQPTFDELIDHMFEKSTKSLHQSMLESYTKDNK